MRERNAVERPSEEYERIARIVRPKKNPNQKTGIKYIKRVLIMRLVR